MRNIATLVMMVATCCAVVAFRFSFFFVRRWKADLYSAEVTATRKLRVEQATHTKAMYELRRFCGRIKEDMER